MKCLNFCLIFSGFLIICSKCASPCAYNATRKSLTCHHFLEKPEAEVLYIELLLSMERLLNLTKILEEFPRVHQLSIVGGLSSWIEAEGIHNSSLKILKLNQIHLQHIPNQILTLNLDVLDLTGNDLQLLGCESPKANAKKVYLCDNKWNCSLDLDWILKFRDVLQDTENVTCYGEPYAGKPLLPIATLLQSLNAQCPSICNCSMENIVSDINTDALEPIIKVDCSGRDLTDLPTKLPENTRILHLQRNQISDLSPLVRNPTYMSVSDLFLDDNRVRSIDDLEGSAWLGRFRVLSLCGNDLSQLPSYALDNSLQRNPNMPNAVRVFLGGNPWRCDCVFTPGFQEMLHKYKTQVADVDDVRCSFVPGDENSLLSISTISRSSVCRPAAEFSARALDLLNGVLASLIILILGKLAYDYYHFKRTGKLPWIVMKMP